MKAPEDYADLLASQPTRYSRTGPPAKHGVRDLLLGLVAALLLSAALPGCATPERLTGVAPHKLNYSDARTKHAEPVASRIR